MQQTSNSIAEQYKRDGFYIRTQSIYPPTMVEDAVTGMDQIRHGIYDTGRPPRPSPWQPGDDPNQLCKIESPQFANHAIRRLISFPGLGELAAHTTGAEAVQIWWIQLLFKPPITGGGAVNTNVGIHQDWTYWQGTWADGSELFTAWVALSDVGTDAGPMKFVRGSQRWGNLAESDFFEQDLDAQRSKIQAATEQEWVEVPAILAPGGVSIHNKLTWHGSGPNLTAGPRRSFAIHMRTQASAPRNGQRQGLAEFVREFDVCPVIYGDPEKMDFGD